MLSLNLRIYTTLQLFPNFFLDLGHQDAKYSLLGDQATDLYYKNASFSIEYSLLSYKSKIFTLLFTSGHHAAIFNPLFDHNTPPTLSSCKITYS